MKALLRAFSYIFHPLWLPIGTVLFYLYTTPRFIYDPIAYSKLFATTLLTIVIPILSYFMLKNLQIVTSVHLPTPRERIVPLFMQALFTTLLVLFIFKGYEFPELHYFFTGVLGGVIAALVLAILGFKASLHMMAMAGVLMYIVGVSLHFKADLTLFIALWVLFTGATATSRLLVKAHTIPELIIGFLIGAVPQFLTYPYWL